MKRAIAILALCVGAAWSSTALAQSSITRNAGEGAPEAIGFESADVTVLIWLSHVAAH